MSQPKKQARKPRHIAPIPCPNCGQEIEPTALMQPEGLCFPCWCKARANHEQYRQDKAILIADVEPCVWTEDLFGSELIIEQDGCYLQIVCWSDRATRHPHQSEQIECFDVQTWQDIWAEAQALSRYYEVPNYQIEDAVTQSIWLRIGDEFVEMQSQQYWMDQSKPERFRALWNQLHSKSPWLERLQLT